MQGRVMMKIIKLAEYKLSSVNLMKDNLKNSKKNQIKKVKELEEEIKKLKLKLNNQTTQSKQTV